jgi:hypothetical protein
MDSTIDFIRCTGGPFCAWLSKESVIQSEGKSKEFHAINDLKGRETLEVAAYDGDGMSVA